MEIERRRRSQPPSPPPPTPEDDPVAAATAAMSLVLGDDDLLREILLGVGLPTSLLRGALVCRRWCRLSSDPAFLRRFHDRHPPRVLGAYLDTAGGPNALPRFVPIRPLPELATAARRAGSFFDAFKGSSATVIDSRGGRILVTAKDDRYDTTQFVCSPLSPGRDTVVVPSPPPPPPIQLTSDEEFVIYNYGEVLPDDGDGSSYFCLLIGYSEQQTTVHLYELQDMRWAVRVSAAAEIPASPPKSSVMLIEKSRLYLLSTINKILVCDFPSASISVMELPNGVENKDNGCIMLSQGDDSRIYLIDIKESQFCISVRSTDSENANWLLVDTICLREVCTTLGLQAFQIVDGYPAGLRIHSVGDNARFVFLEMSGAVVFLDITSKQAEKVYEMTPEDKYYISIRPLMTIWPPVFPVLKERDDQKD